MKYIKGSTKVGREDFVRGEIDLIITDVSVSKTLDLNPGGKSFSALEDLLKPGGKAIFTDTSGVRFGESQTIYEAAGAEYQGINKGKCFVRFTAKNMTTGRSIKNILKKKVLRLHKWKIFSLGLDMVKRWQTLRMRDVQEL
ncbi:MAG: hypothetical protein LBB21_00070 [Holosporaceae bacterium]|jgi:hypothetical protein|nr:hypothetical protein [Holosporaceae bacterium]